MFDTGWDRKTLKIFFTPDLPFPQVEIVGRIICFGVATRQITIAANTTTVPGVVTTTASICTSTNTCSPGCTGTENCNGTQTNPGYVTTQTNVTTEQYTIAYCMDQGGNIYLTLPTNIRIRHEIHSNDF